MAKTETLINELTINYLTKEQYEEAVANGEINENELYMTPSDGDGGGSGLPEVTSNKDQMLLATNKEWGLVDVVDADTYFFYANGNEVAY